MHARTYVLFLNCCLSSVKKVYYIFQVNSIGFRDIDFLHNIMYLKVLCMWQIYSFDS